MIAQHSTSPRKSGLVPCLRPGLAALALALALAAPGASPALAQGQAGTTLSASKTAIGFQSRVIEYDWSLEKTAVPDFNLGPFHPAGALNLAEGQTGTATFTIKVCRTVKSDTGAAAGVRGVITVTNGGSRATEGLTITDVIQYKIGSGPFLDLKSSPVSTSANPVLSPGETGTYPYEITFTPIPGAQYRNTARVTITNHSGHLNEAFGPAFNGGGVKADFSLPGGPVSVTEIDECATVTDAMADPRGVLIVNGLPLSNTVHYPVGPFLFTGADLDAAGCATRTYSVQVTPGPNAIEYEPDNDRTTLDNFAVLTECDTGDTGLGYPHGNEFTEIDPRTELAWVFVNFLP